MPTIDGKGDTGQQGTMRSLIALIPLLASACAATVDAPAPPLAVTRSPPMIKTGLDRVLGQTARGLTALFGEADQDVKEAEGARRMQFAGPICILDAYLYPARSGESEVTYVDARQPDGRDIDRASCVAALTRRKEAR
ncbi:hypothetical protein [Sphingomonas sp. SUN039]|uniref:hypothetical protein n=1 Tax=Sphingomonas sp. SUN039 TaxID=2937787 RepID=UPI0021645F02|nr:hypothetical protein [Sphingomonas sp. SUN039]UVO55002.1 hypothetical protein M0209_13005 [Sphingomonas sp. SUN039]